MRCEPWRAAARYALPVAVARWCQEDKSRLRDALCRYLRG
jgi:hypothetical protein